MSKIDINIQKCTKCHSCIKDCVCGLIQEGADGYPEVDTERLRNCIGCTHCIAVCPNSAISFDNKKPAEAFNIENIDSENILKLIRQRRSIRQYKNEDIPEDLLEKLEAMFPYIPSGCNQKSIHFSIIRNRKTMDELRDYVIKSVFRVFNCKPLSFLVDKYILKYKLALKNGEDIIFRNAPSIIVVSAPILTTCTNINPIIALSYIELYAQSLGLGTCYSGFGDCCFKMIPELSQMIGIPEGYKPIYVMSIGIPDVKYHRTTIPDSYEINTVTSLNKDKMTLLSKIKRYLVCFLR